MNRGTPALLILALALALALPACRPTTYTLPTDQFPFDPRKAEPEDRAEFNTSARHSAFWLLAHLPDDNPAQPAQNQKSNAIALAPLFQTALAILNSSEGQTYRAAATIAQTLAPDEFSLNQGFSEWLATYSPQDLHLRSSIWMVWPIPLEFPYVKDMAEHYRVDVIRLGSVGLTAQAALDDWSAEVSQGRLPQSPVRLNKSDQIAVHAHLSLRAPFPPEAKARPATLSARPAFALLTHIHKTPNWTAATTPLQTTNQGKLALAALLPAETSSNLPTPTLEDWQALLKSIPTPRETLLPTVSLDTTLRLRPLLERAGATQLFAAGNDFRHMSVELTGDYRLGTSVLTTALHLDHQGVHPTPPAQTNQTPPPTPIEGQPLAFDRPFWIFVYDPKTQIPLLAAQVFPQTSPAD